jgi:5-methyltetrahydrofolate--homocysteine methyltransferase
MSRLEELLAERPVLFADGGMGTGLFAQGLETGDSPELWNVSHPERVANVHRGFVEAGSDIILTNTFGANARRLMLHHAQDRVRELNMAGVRVARSVADAAGRPVLVAGSMGPTGDIFAPVGPLAYEDGVAAFRTQAEALAEAGADILWIETISAAEEMSAALEATKGLGVPVVSTMTFDTNGRTMMGLTPEAALSHVHSADCAREPMAFGANCGIGPSQLLHSVLHIVGAATDPNQIVIAKGNCGIPKYREGQIVYSGTPEIMATYATLARDAGARIIGGCCGTTGAHLKAMIAAVNGTPKGPSPDIETVEALLGPLTAGVRPAQAEESRGERRRRRG